VLLYAVKQCNHYCPLQQCKEAARAAEARAGQLESERASEHMKCIAAEGERDRALALIAQQTAELQR
jgi:hypothetical protein